MTVINNGKLVPEYEAVDLSVPDIAFRSIITLVKGQHAADLVRLAEAADRAGFLLRVASIP